MSMTDHAEQNYTRENTDLHMTTVWRDINIEMEIRRLVYTEVN